jgi:hypothetical protein
MKWFDTKESDSFAKAIVAELTERIPPQGLDFSEGKKAVEKLTKTHSSICSKTAQFAQLHALNIYQKASFGNTFKWALKEAGYPQDFIDAWTQEIVTIVSVKPGKSGK